MWFVIMLALVQGLTEFLPVSSSAHLMLVPYLAGGRLPGLTLEVALHAGTLLAVVVHYRRDLAALSAGFVRGVPSARREVALLAVASLPAGLAGLALRSWLEQVFHAPRWVAGFLLVTAMLLVSTRFTRRRAERRDVGVLDALLVGVAQAGALFPGVSRSGSTIAVAMARGLSPSTAARLSFLMSVPVTAGALLVVAPDIAAAGVAPLEMVAGTAVAFISGLVAIRWLVGLLVRRSLVVFAGYVTALAVAVLVVASA